MSVYWGGGMGGILCTSARVLVCIVNEHYLGTRLVSIRAKPQGAAAVGVDLGGVVSRCTGTFHPRQERHERSASSPHCMMCMYEN